MDFIHRIFGYGAHTVAHPNRHEHLEALKARYRPVLNLMESKGVAVEDIYLEGERLVIRGQAPSPEARASVFSLVDLLDQNRGDLSVAIDVRGQGGGRKR